MPWRGCLAPDTPPPEQRIDITVPNETETRRGPQDWFTGSVSLEPVGEQPPPGRVQVVLVRFEPGARTAWHTHPFGQILHVLQGRARVQSASGEVVEVQPGASVRFGAGEDHWHGATPDEPMVHLAIQEANPDGVATAWGRHVTDDEYHGR